MLLYTPPTDTEQLVFLKNIQRLLNEGSFVASYKFALLHALADLAILKGNDTGEPLRLSITDIAEQIVLLYWQQAKPFNDRKAAFILMQNAGPRQAAIVNYLTEAHKESGGSLFQYRKDRRAWSGLVRSVASVVKTMPLWKLQTVGGEQLSFLYERPDDQRGTIELNPGVAYCFRAFYPMLCNLFRSAWIDYVRRFNIESLGQITDLREFMFGGERLPLAHSVVMYQEIQDNRCLYCQGKLADIPEVDHFIPWSRCRSDLAHNLVLAHKGCNAAKSDFLACEDHLQAWTKRNRALVGAASGQFDRVALPHDLNVSERIAQWAYSQTEQTHGQVWVIRKNFKPLGAVWRDLLFDLQEAITLLKHEDATRRK
jgi:hypothetical protein